MFNYIFKISKKNLIFVSLLAIFWLSINTGSKYINFNQVNELNLSYYINFIRAILPYLILILFVFKYKKFLKELKFKDDLIFLFFILYGIIQILGLSFSNVSNNEHYWIVCLFTLIIFYKNALKEDNSNQINIIFITNILFIFVIFTIFTFLALKDNIISYNLVYHSNVFNDQFVGEYFPRSTGISRMALIIFFFVNSLYFSKLFEKKLNFIILFLISFLVLIMLLLQSRTIILFFVISYIAIHIIFKFYNFKERLKYTVISIIIPILLFISYPVSKNYLIQKFDVKTEDMKEDVDEMNFIRNDFLFGADWNVSNLSEKKSLASFSNNRIEAWNYLLQVFFKGQINENIKRKIISQGYITHTKIDKKKINFFVGFGPQADRYFFTAIEKKVYNKAKSVLGPFGAHASNIYVYSLICGGLISFVIIIIINLLVLYKILQVIVNREKLNIPKNFFLMSSIFIILFLMFRGLVENSYGVFGVDLIIFFSAYTIISKNIKKIND